MQKEITNTKRNNKYKINTNWKNKYIKKISPVPNVEKNKNFHL